MSALGVASAQACLLGERESEGERGQQVDAPPGTWRIPNLYECLERNSQFRPSKVDQGRPPNRPHNFQRSMDWCMVGRPLSNPGDKASNDSSAALVAALVVLSLCSLSSPSCLSFVALSSHSRRREPGEAGRACVCVHSLCFGCALVVLSLCSVSSLPCLF